MSALSTFSPLVNWSARPPRQLLIHSSAGVASCLVLAFNMLFLLGAWVGSTIWWPGNSWEVSLLTACIAMAQWTLAAIGMLLGICGSFERDCCRVTAAWGVATNILSAGMMVMIALAHGAF